MLEGIGMTIEDGVVDDDDRDDDDDYFVDECTIKYLHVVDGLQSVW